MTPEPRQAAGLRTTALTWFVRRRDPGWDQAQEDTFQQWLTLDRRHGQMYAHCEARWASFDGMPPDLVARMRKHPERADDLALTPDLPVLAPLDSAGSRPQARAVRDRERRPEASSRRRFLRPILTAASLAALMAGLCLFGWRQFQAQPAFAQAFDTARGQQRDVSLPDGSQLRLDTATRIEVTYSRYRRQARLLEGQAVFAVQADAGRPFDVLAGAVRVTVVGTRFSVRHTPGIVGNEGVQVAVEHGKVRVATIDAKGEQRSGVLLLADQQIASDPLGRLGPVGPVPAAGIAAWRGRRISFVDAPLGQAIAELERYGSTGMVVRDPTVAALRLSGTFDPADPAALRLALPRILPVRLHAVGNTTEIVRAR